MEKLFFWKQWPKNEAIVYSILLAVFILFLAGYGAAYFFGEGLVYKWEVYNNIKPIQVPVKTIQTGIYDFFIEGTNYLNFQEYVASTIHIPQAPAVLLTVVFIAGISLILAAATYMNRFWFIVLMGMAIFLMVMLQLNSLELFGSVGRTGLIIALVLFILPAYYFHAVNSDIKLLYRVLAMLALSGVFIAIIAVFSESGNPFVAFAGYGMIPPILLSIVFVVLVGHEIGTAFLYVITNNNNEFSKNSSLHFVAISMAYLLLVLFTFLYNIQIINWQLIYLNAFLILAISALLGIWGFRHKRILYENVFGFQTVGGIIYLALGIICFGTLAYFFLTANDPAIEAFEDIILFTQLGFGIGFFLYIMANFFTLLHYDKQVYKIVYKPTKMPYFTAQLAGVAASVAFYFLSGQISLHQSKAARYNAIGGYYYSIDQPELAREYYKQGAIFGYRNHLSNFNLASIYLQEDDVSNAVFHFNEAKQKNPTEHAFINLSHVYDQNGSYFESLFSLQDGLKRFPTSGVIANNLALRYNKTNVLDSALYYIFLAQGQSYSRKRALANEYGFYADKKIRLSVDSLPRIYHDHDNEELKTHILALMNQTYHQMPLNSVPSSLEDSLLTINQYAFLQNYLTNQKSFVDSSVLNRSQNLIANAGSFFANPLAFAEAMSHYGRNSVYHAMEQIQWLQNSAVELRGFYARALASLALDQMAPQLAMDFLNLADDPESDEQTLKLFAIASVMLGNTSTLEKILESLHGDHRFDAIRKTLWLTSIKNIEDDGEKYYYVILRGLSMQPYEMAGHISLFDDKRNAVKAMKYLISLNLNHWNPVQAEVFLGLLRPLLEKGDPFYINADLKILYQKNDLNGLFAAFAQTDKEAINPQDFLLYSALHDTHHKNPEAAESKFHRLAESNPFFEEGILEAAEYFAGSEDEWKSYNILLKAVRFNKYSEKLHQAYTLHSLNKGLTDYAMEGLLQLEDLMEAGEFREFRHKFDSIRSARAQKW